MLIQKSLIIAAIVATIVTPIVTVVITTIIFFGFFNLFRLFLLRFGLLNSFFWLRGFCLGCKLGLLLRGRQRWHHGLLAILHDKIRALRCQVLSVHIATVIVAIVDKLLVFIHMIVVMINFDAAIGVRV